MNPTFKRELEAYHEAGHTVVGHVLGRCIERVALTTGKEGYRGYCKFNAFIEDANGYPQWRERHNHPDLITVYYAGMLACAIYSSFYVIAEEEENCVPYPVGSERDDLEQINNILSEISVDDQQREKIANASWIQAQKILSKYQLTVDALAMALRKRGSLSGSDAHRLIWQAVGYPNNDWRLQALNIKP